MPCILRTEVRAGIAAPGTPSYDGDGANLARASGQERRAPVEPTAGAWLPLAECLRCDGDFTTSQPRSTPTTGHSPHGDCGGPSQQRWAWVDTEEEPRPFGVHYTPCFSRAKGRWNLTGITAMRVLAEPTSLSTMWSI